VSNVTVKNTTIKSFNYGVLLYVSSRNSIVENNITHNTLGIYLQWYSSNNSIVGNNITENEGWGIYLWYSSSNNIVGNNIADSDNGIELSSSSSNSIVGNNITESNYTGIRLTRSSNNVLRDNSMASNRWNFLVLGSALSDFVNDVDASNTVDAKMSKTWVHREF